MKDSQTTPLSQAAVELTMRINGSISDCGCHAVIHGLDDIIQTALDAYADAKLEEAAKNGQRVAKSYLSATEDHHAKDCIDGVSGRIINEIRALKSKP